MVLLRRLPRGGRGAQLPARPDRRRLPRAAATRPRRAYDDPAHPEVVLRLSYAGVRLAEDAFDWAGRAERVGADAWELRFRSPPAELRYHAREIHALGSDAVVLAPPELRALVRERAAATLDVYAATGSATHDGER